VNIDDCVGSEFYRQLFVANLVFWVINTILGVSILLYRKFQRGAKVIVNRRLSAFEGLAIGFILQTNLQGIYAALIISGGWGQSYIVRELLWILSFTPFYYTFLNFILRISETVLIGRVKPVISFRFVEGLFITIIVLTAVISIVLSILTGYYHDQGSPAQETLTFSLEWILIGILAIIPVFVVIIFSFLVVKKLHDVRADLRERRKGSKEKLATFVTRDEFEEGDAIEIDKSGTKVVYNEVRIKHDQDRILAISVLSAFIFLIYGGGCIVLGAYPDFFTNQKFRELGAVYSLTASNWAACVFPIILAVLEGLNLCTIHQASNKAQQST